MRLTVRVLAHFQAVGEELRRGQDVAQIVADLGHGPAKLGQPLLLLERAGQLGLQRLQGFFGLAQFGMPSRGAITRRASSGAAA